MQRACCEMTLNYSSNPKYQGEHTLVPRCSIWYHSETETHPTTYQQIATTTTINTATITAAALINRYTNHDYDYCQRRCEQRKLCLQLGHNDERRCDEGEYCDDVDDMYDGGCGEKHMYYFHEIQQIILHSFHAQQNSHYNLRFHLSPTLWKFQDFSVSQILREINFVQF